MDKESAPEPQSTHEFAVTFLVAANDASDAYDQLVQRLAEAGLTDWYSIEGGGQVEPD